MQIWRLPPILIVHLKRFHYVNGRWIKSHKIVDFPNDKFDPTDYLAAIPQQTIRRHQELISLGSRARSTICVNSRSRVMSQCNGTINEISENESSITDHGSSLDTEEDDEATNHHQEVINKSKYENLDDSAVGQSDSTGENDTVFDDISDDDDDDDDFDVPSQPSESVIKKNVIFSPTTGRRGGRKRQQSTSLMRNPIEDDNLKDFHEHRLKAGRDPFDISYNLYSTIVRINALAGILPRVLF